MNHPLKNKIHIILAHSYSVYFLLFLLGFLLDFFFQYKIVPNKLPILEIIGWLFVIFSSMIILWAQRTSKNLDKEKKVNLQNNGNLLTKESFCNGPYCYTRHPTHWGILFLIIGFSFIINSFFVLVFAIFSLFVTKLFFLKNQDSILEKKYGNAYLDYKKMVKF